MIDENLRKIATITGMQIDCGFVGDKNAEYAIVLESPGEADIKLDTPLSGGSGTALFNVLKQYNIDRKNCYITCAVKRKLPLLADNFRLDDTELSNWRNILNIELESLPNLKCILCLGRFGLKLFTNENSIVDWRGSILPYTLNNGKEIKICYTFNPMYIFREPKWEVIFKFDLYKFYLLCSGKYQEHYIKAIINPTASEALKYIYKIQNEKKPFALDIETMGNEMCCVGLANDIHEGICINFRDQHTNRYTIQEEKNIRVALCRLLTDPNSKIITQNGSFDDSWLGYKDRFPVFKCYFDTLLAHHTLYPRLPHNLGFLTSVYTMHPFYKDEGKTWKRRWKY